MTGGGEGDRHGAAQHETAVSGHIGDVQHPVAEEEGHGHQRILEAQLQGGLSDIEHGKKLLSCQRPRRNTGGLNVKYADGIYSAVVSTVTTSPRSAKTAGSTPSAAAVSELTVMMPPVTW